MRLTGNATGVHHLLPIMQSKTTEQYILSVDRELYRPQGDPHSPKAIQPRYKRIQSTTISMVRKSTQSNRRKDWNDVKVRRGCRGADGVKERGMYREKHQEPGRPILLLSSNCQVGSFKPEEGRMADGGMGVRLSHNTLRTGEPSTLVHACRDELLGKGTTGLRSLAQEISTGRKTGVL